MDSFTEAYIITSLWSSHDDSDESGGESMDTNYTKDDIASATFVQMALDCKRFLATARPIIEAAIETGKVRCGPDFDEWGRAGHDFWLTRNRHGAGFWDGDWPEPMAEQLTYLAHGFGHVDLYVGDDNLIRGS